MTFAVRTKPFQADGATVFVPSEGGADFNVIDPDFVGQVLVQGKGHGFAFISARPIEGILGCIADGGSGAGNQ